MSAAPSRIRPAEPRDLAAVVDLLNACDVVETGCPDTTTQDVENDWSLEGFDVSRDAWVAVADDGRITGYAYTGDQLGASELEADFWIDPEHDESGLAERLLNLAERRTRELARARSYGDDATLSIFCITVDRAKRELLQRRGFRLVRTAYRLAAELRAPTGPPSPPAGVEIRPFRAGEDESVMYATLMDACSHHHRRGNPPFEAWRTKLLGHGDFDPGLWFLAWDGDQAVGGLMAYDHGDIGWVTGLGVSRPWRRQGIGGALLARAFVELARRGQRRVELGVEAETPALAVYERAGMRVTFSYESYMKHLVGPGVSSP